MTTNHGLADQIEQLVRRHLEAARTAAAAAVERAFAQECKAGGVSQPGGRATSGRRRAKPAPQEASDRRGEGAGRSILCGAVPITGGDDDDVGTAGWRDAAGVAGGGGAAQARGPSARRGPAATHALLPDDHRGGSMIAVRPATRRRRQTATGL